MLKMKHIIAVLIYNVDFEFTNDKRTICGKLWPWNVVKEEPRSFKMSRVIIGLCLMELKDASDEVKYFYSIT